MDRGVVMTTLLFILWWALCLWAITLSLFTSSVSAVSMMQLPYTWMDDNREVLYDLEFIKANDYSSHENNMKMKWSTFVISSKPIIINSLWYAWVINRANEVNYWVYGNILWWNYNKISSENVTVIAWEYNEVNIWNDNAVVLGWKNNKIYSWSSLQWVLVWWSWNRIKDSEWVNSIIWWGNNIISWASNVNILWWNRNTVIEWEDVIVWGSNVQVWSNLRRSFIFSDGRWSFSPTAWHEWSNTFYLNVENGVWINALSNWWWVSLWWAMFIWEINIDSLRCTSSDLWVEWVWNGCLVWCTQFSHNLTEWWELLSQWDKCESLCEGSSRCVSISSVEDLSDTYASSCSKWQISNTNNAIMCSEAALWIYENVIFETSLIDSEEECPVWDNKCVYQCVKWSHLTWDTTWRWYGVWCFRDCELRWSTGDYIRHNQQSTWENWVYLCVDGTLNLSWCLNGYHTEDYSTCVSNTKQEQCIQSWAPDHSHYKSQLVNVTWNGWWDYGSWTQPSICGWECDSDYHLSSDGKKCEFNHKNVQCQTWTKPENSEYIITTDWIEWNAQPSVCGYECNTWYVMSWAMWATWTVCVSGTVETYKCYWLNYYWAVLVPWSDENLTSNGSYVLYNSYEEAKDHKCAYYCPAGKIKMGDYCAKKINMCKGEMPSNSVVNNVYPDNDSTYYYYSWSEAPCAFTCGEGYVYTWNITTWSVASTGTCVFAGTYSCQWVMPQGAKLLKWSDSGLTGNVNKTLYESVDKARWHKCAYYCDEWYSYKVKSNWESTCEKQQTYACKWTYPTGDNNIIVSSVLPTNPWVEYYYDEYGTGWACSFTCQKVDNEWCSFYHVSKYHWYYDSWYVWHHTDASSWTWDWIYSCSYRCGYSSCNWPEKVSQSHTVMNNYDTPDENMDYYYSTNASDVCTFSCEQWYVYTWTALSWACVSWSVEPKVEYKCTWTIPDDFHATFLKWSDQWLTQDTNKKFYKDPSGKKCAYYCDESKWYWFGSEDIWCIWQDSTVDVECGWSIPDNAHNTSISDFDRNAWFYWNWKVYSKAEFKHSDESWYCTFQCDDWYKWNGSSCAESVRSYEVTYNYSTNGWSSSSPLKAQIQEGSDAISWATALKAWWDFVWWNTDSSATSALSSYVMPVSWGNVTLYAIFKKQYSVNFYVNWNGWSKSTMTCNVYNNQTSCNVTSPRIVVPSGFTSIWWSTSPSNHTSEWSEWSSKSISSRVGSNYYAQTQKVMNVSYDKNGASSVWHTSDSCNVYNGWTSCITSKAAPSIVREWYDIVWWNTNKLATQSSLNVWASVELNSTPVKYYAITSEKSKNSCDWCPSGKVKDGDTCTTYSASVSDSCSSIKRTSKCNDGSWDVAPLTYWSCRAYYSCPAQWACSATDHNWTCKTYSRNSDCSCASYELTSKCNDGSWSTTPLIYSSCTKPSSGCGPAPGPSWKSCSCGSWSTASCTNGGSASAMSGNSWTCSCTDGSKQECKWNNGWWSGSWTSNIKCWTEASNNCGSFAYYWGCEPSQSWSVIYHEEEGACYRHVECLCKDLNKQ